MDRRLSPVGLFVAAMTVAAIGLLAASDWAVSEVQLAAAATLLAMALLSESGSITVGLGTTANSVAFIPFLSAILLLPPAWAMVVAGTSEACFAGFRRKPMVKVVFNAANHVLAVGLAAYVYILMGGTPSTGELAPAILAFVLAACVYLPLNSAGTALAVSLSSDRYFREAWGRLIASFPYDLCASSFSLVLWYLYGELRFFGALLVIIPLLMIRHVYLMVMRGEQRNQELLELMVKSIEARDVYTSGHSVRVSRFARTLAEEVGLSAKQIDVVANAALLHDIGKIFQEFGPVLRKSSRLTDQEMRLMRSHPVRGAELIGTVSSLRGLVQESVRHHHESFNGRGYPNGLAGDGIPLPARLIAVADAFDAMTTTRPYRPAMAPDQAMAELRGMAGKQFDPEVVRVFCESQRVRSAIDEELDAHPAHQGEAAGSRSTIPSMGQSARWGSRATVRPSV